MSSESGELRRAISGRMLIVFIIGDILGAGIYALVGKYPRAAGAALYTHRAFKRPFFTFLVAFAVMMSGVASASAAALAFGGNYLAQFVTAPTTLAALGFLAVITLVNFIGISESIKVNLVLTIVEVTGLLIVIVVGVVGIARGDGDPARALAFEAPNGALLGVLGATALGFYALLGFEDAVNLAEECHDPHRTFPVALFTGITITGIVYITIAVIAVALVPPARLATSSGPLLDVVNAAGVDFPPELFAAIALLAIGNTALINMIMASRLLYGMANERIVPAAFGVIHKRRRTPIVAIAFTVIISAGLIATGNVKQLAETTVLLLLVVFAVVNCAVLVLRRRPVEHPHFRTPTWAPVLGAATTLFLATPLTGRPAEVYATAGILVGIGAALWGVNRLVTGRRVTDLDAERLVK